MQFVKNAGVKVLVVYTTVFLLKRKVFKFYEANLLLLAIVKQKLKVHKYDLGIR